MRYEIVFSPTGGTQEAARFLGAAWGDEASRIDLSDPRTNFAACVFAPEDVCLVAVPSFGGRVPQVAVERLSQMRGGGAQAVLLCVYGNRAYDDTLLELRETLEKAGMRCRAAVAAVAEHSIMHAFAAGRPDAPPVGCARGNARSGPSTRTTRRRRTRRPVSLACAAFRSAQRTRAR